MFISEAQDTHVKSPSLPCLTRVPSFRCQTQRTTVISTVPIHQPSSFKALFLFFFYFLRVLFRTSFLPSLLHDLAGSLRFKYSTRYVAIFLHLPARADSLTRFLDPFRPGVLLIARPRLSVLSVLDLLYLLSCRRFRDYS